MLLRLDLTPERRSRNNSFNFLKKAFVFNS